MQPEESWSSFPKSIYRKHQIFPSKPWTFAGCRGISWFKFRHFHSKPAWSNWCGAEISWLSCKSPLSRRTVDKKWNQFREYLVHSKLTFLRVNRLYCFFLRMKQFSLKKNEEMKAASLLDCASRWPRIISSISAWKPGWSRNGGPCLVTMILLPFCSDENKTLIWG